jgi:hypothetical protein
MGGECGTHGRNAYTILVGKPAGKRPRGRPRLSVGRCELDAPGSVYGPVVGSCEHGNEPSG